MKVKRLGTYVGAVVEGFALDGNDHSQRDTIRELLLEHKALFFKAQNLKPSEFVAVARNIGTPEVHPFLSGDEMMLNGFSLLFPYAEHPEINGVYHDEKNTRDFKSWHSDQVWHHAPSSVTMLRSVLAPPVGGDTCWADMSEAYNSLSESMKRDIDGLQVVHDWVQSYGTAFEGNESAFRRLRKYYPAQMHPLVLRHPWSGEKVLFSNRVSAVRIEGLPEAESRSLLDMLHLRAWLPEFQCRFHWEEGDVAISENLATQHYAVSDYWPHPRKLERITLAGSPLQ
ncbi:TauD/TfdA family dioxygenase [Streptomyces sp. NPDC001851]|uniref:TauD/TfdA dioxygenase family protein n=1 Tax=Streptomyces sp. NPDC001851 TaxID=3154529 RepID=UPI003324ABBD